jgi:hypothetical protein
MFIAGCNETIIAQHGRWKSLTYRRYFDATVPHYTATMLLHRHSVTVFHPQPRSSPMLVPRPLPLRRRRCRRLRSVLRC